MITLYGAGAGFGLPEISPYVTKTEVQLKMAGLGYIKVQARPDESPKGQMPFIDAGGVRIADSTFIRGYIERTYGVDFDEGLDAAQRAQAWAIERMMENHLCWTLVAERWLDPENFAKGPARFFDGAPEAVREMVLDEVRRNVRAVGIGRHTDLEVVALAVRSLAAVSTLLGDKPYLFGSRPCGADATVFGVLAGILTPFFTGEIRRRAEGFGNLVAYVDRLMAQFYPEFAWDLEASVRAPVAA
ncbi:MAG: glutathione S-transferase family protein [Alphaproteobacteria bacterium]|nr:glutathione S-transferase family protein [Alphaproteobacteria bacterium]MBU1517056.1 glutathione S-transferase family protein [Alphaproteobacteria bacterium]MBU2093675.1 glutathione S-transferase family protein [Alphaproteobacteria bacterium]MBU2154003.1 glutathione S-transferase family protein [Alphaproteobacteria bacterium]MBU2308725.1 glutathione S-transferase family protein [Alphaproteobacteria bacterium]